MKIVEKILFILIGASIGTLMAYSNSPVIQALITGLMTIISGTFMFFYKTGEKSQFIKLNSSTLSNFAFFIVALTVSGITILYVKQSVENKNFMDKYTTVVYKYSTQRSNLINSWKLNKDKPEIISKVRDSIIILDHLFMIEQKLRGLNFVQNENTLIQYDLQKGLPSINKQNGKISSITLPEIKFLNSEFLYANDIDSGNCENLSRISTYADLQNYLELFPMGRLKSLIDSLPKKDDKTIRNFLRNYCKK